MLCIFSFKNTPFNVSKVIECYWKKSDQGIVTSPPPFMEAPGNVVPGSVGAVVTTAEFVRTSSRENSINSKSALS